MLSIYVRHTKACLPGLIAKGLSVEKQRAYKHCPCPKWYSGTHDGKRHPRTTLNANSWESAEKALAKIKDGEQPEISGISVEKAIQAWMGEVVLNNPAESTVVQWKLITSKLLKFCERRKINLIQNLDPAAVNQWRGEWPHEKTNRGIGLRPNTMATRITVLKLFFKFVRRMRWVNEDPMILIKIAKREKDEEEHQTLPLDLEGDANYRALLKAIPIYFGGLRRCIGPISKSPEHLVALVELMYETGLRISDAVAFQLDMVEVDEKDGWGSYTAKQKKTKQKVTVAIPPELMSKLQKLLPISSRFLFHDGNTKLATFYRSQIWPNLKAAGKLAGIANMRPHRLRDSFAVNRLNEGMLIQDVSRLLGHTSITITEKYYAPFVKSRKDALMSKRKDLHGVTPVRAKVLSIRKRA